MLFKSERSYLDDGLVDQWYLPESRHERSPPWQPIDAFIARMDQIGGGSGFKCLEAENPRQSILSRPAYKMVFKLKNNI